MITFQGYRLTEADACNSDWEKKETGRVCFTAAETVM